MTKKTDTFIFEEIINAIKNEEKQILKLETKTEELEKANNSYLKISHNNSKNTDRKIDEIKIQKTNNIKENSNINNEIEYYLSLIKQISYSKNFENDIEAVLPNKNKLNYDILIIAIKTELLKEIKDIKDLIDENDISLSERDLNEFKDEIILLNDKIKAINNLTKTKKVQEEIILNNLIFVPTNNGSIRVLDEIKEIQNINHLFSFKKLFDSIKDGTLKNVKQYNLNQNQEKPISQVRHNEARVVYEQIGKNEFAIITAFIKDGQNEKLYRNTLALKINNYFNQKEKIKNNLFNQEFLDINKLYEDELYNILNKSTSKTSDIRKEK